MSVVNVGVKYIRPQYNDLQAWMQDQNNVYIGRRGIVFIQGKRYPSNNSPFANPFKIGRDGTRDEVLAKYRTYIGEKINNGLVDLNNLRNKNLGCWCAPESCHGDILLELLNSSL